MCKLLHVVKKLRLNGNFEAMYFKRQVKLNYYRTPIEKKANFLLITIDIFLVQVTELTSFTVMCYYVPFIHRE